MHAKILALPLVMLLGLAPLASQSKPTSRPTKDKHGITMDALSRTTLDRWEAMEYHAGRRGLKSISFSVDVTSKSPLGEAKSKGKYTFDGNRSKLTWDNPALGNMLGQRGWSAKTLEKMFKGDSHRAELKKTTLTAKKNADGSVTIAVQGKTKGGYKSFSYDKNGVASHFIILVNDPTTGEVEATIRLKSKKVGRLYVRTGWSYEMDLPQGKFVGSVAVKNVKVAKHHLYSEVTETLRMGDQDLGKNVLKFTEYKVNGVKGASTTSKPTTRPAPKAGKSAKKPGLRAIKVIEKGPPKQR